MLQPLPSISPGRPLACLCGEKKLRNVSNSVRLAAQRPSNPPVISSFSHDVPTRNTESSLLRRHGGGRRRRRGEGVGREGGAPQRPPSALRTGSWSREVAGWTLGSMRGLCRSEQENTGTQKHRLPGRRHAANRRAEPRRKALGLAGQIESLGYFVFCFFSPPLPLPAPPLPFQIPACVREALVNAWQIIFLHISGERAGR